MLAEGGSPVLSAAPTATAPAAPAASASPARATAPADHETVILFWKTLGEATAARTAGDCTAAIPIYRRALALHPGHEDALYYLGQCLQALGRTDEAHSALIDLVTVNPSSSRGHLALGSLALWREGAPDLEGAQHEFEQAHALNKEESGAMLQLGEVALVRGEGARASEWLRAALRTNPRNLEAAFLLGYLEWRAGNAAAAARRCAEAIAMAAPPAAPQGVKSEGDRQAAAPPLTSPMGRTLFSDFSDRLRTAGPTDASAAAACASSFYPAVDQRIDALKRRTKTPAA
jgi:tetratricopeptide (TPR) repeat protein